MEGLEKKKPNYEGKLTGHLQCATISGTTLMCSPTSVVDRVV